jgi:hypothetical protein
VKRRNKLDETLGGGLELEVFKPPELNPLFHFVKKTNVIKVHQGAFTKSYISRGYNKGLYHRLMPRVYAKRLYQWLTTMFYTKGLYQEYT